MMMDVVEGSVEDERFSEVLEVDSTYLILYHLLQLTISFLPALIITKKWIFSKHSFSLPAYNERPLQLPQQVLHST